MDFRMDKCIRRHLLTGKLKGAQPHALPPHMQQHRPGMPSTSNGPGSYPYGCPPMDQPNGYYNMNGPMGMMPNMMMNPQTPVQNGMPPYHAPYYNQGLPSSSMTPPVNMTNGDYHATSMGTPNPPRVPSSGPPARSSPFTAQSIPQNGAPMLPPYPGRVPPSGYYPNGMPNVPPNVGFVFTSEMANQAVHDVQQGKQPTVAHWHSAHQNANSQAIPPNMPKNARNSPSYQNATTSGSRKRKGSQAVERQNSTLSPQLHQTTSPEFKQPMSNNASISAPNSVPNMSMLQQQHSMSGMPAAKQIKTEASIKQETLADGPIKTENSHPNNTEGLNPIKSLEQMATQSEIPTKSNKPDAGNASREQKFAILEHLKNQLNYTTPQPPPPGYNFRYAGPQMIPRPNGMYYQQPPNGPEMFQQMNYSAPQQPPPGYNFRYAGPQMIPRPNGMYYQQPPNGPEMFHQWPQDGPQSLANLDSRVPSQKINYYSNKSSL
ncbi:hypothetical protein M3Y94_00228700 [Aphelenchoides besseyi]|nr:hypothetical protein M3Y94_00228700 [Aphelenchoides besseyi]